MALNIITAIKLLGQSGSIASSVTSLIKEYKKFKESGSKTDDLKNAIELQSEINEKLVKQIELLSSSLKNLQKSLKILFIVVGISLLLILISLGLIIFR